MLRTASRLRYLYLAWLSGPSHQRQLYRLIRKQRIRSIVEIGIGHAQRAVRMIEVAQGTPPVGPIRYTGIDAFESRDSGEGLTLKAAYRTLKPTGARVQVVPGDPFSALSRVANTLLGTELLIVSADQSETAMAQAWFYVPRMLVERSIVLLEEKDTATGRTQLKPMHATEIARLSRQGSGQRLAA
jgi:hypothetical protein